MKLRNGKQYGLRLQPTIHVPPARILSEHEKSIFNLLKKYLLCYYISIEQENDMKEYTIQRIRYFREFYYFVEYYDLKQISVFTNFIAICKNNANCLIADLKGILNRSGRNKGFRLTGQDKINAEGLIQDLERFLNSLKF
jgi:hypothetical protein